jgi:uncharacterized protein (DUF2147 family)
MKILTLVLFFLLPSFGADLKSPVGLWKTIDDKTGKPRGLIRIYEQNGKFFGRIEKSLVPGESGNKLCKVCKDDRKDQPMIGLVMMRNMQLQGGEYRGGDILDPDSGSVYKCKFQLAEGGVKLEVRGFVGFSMLGRSQTWIREAD